MTQAIVLTRPSSSSSDNAMADDRYRVRAAPADSERDVVEPTSENLRLDNDLVGPGDDFPPHYHSRDQLAWMAGGAMTVAVAGTQWRLRRAHLVWIPAGFLHDMSFAEQGELISMYSDVRLRPRGSRWDRPHVLATDPLVEALLWHLQTTPRGVERRRRCLALLHDVLRESDVEHDAIAVPADQRARKVAAALLADPSDPRELRGWAQELGVSERTLARRFDETGLSFRRWRAQVRLQAAAGRLERGESVAEVADAVGYSTASAFVSAFRGRFGQTPGGYAREHTRMRQG